MSDCLKDFTGITSELFFTGNKKREKEYYQFLDHFDEPWELGGVELEDYYPDYSEVLKLIRAKKFIEVCYYSRELQVLDNFKKELKKITEKVKFNLYVEITITELDLILKKVTELKLDKNLQNPQNHIIRKLENLKSTFYSFYQKNIETAPTPKIQWLGKTNLLATLIYDLWQGQERGRGNARTKTSQLIKADKKDLEQLLINNFISAKGTLFTNTTISDYLNTSKPEKRINGKGRIELPE